ncbi:hypothetical protein SCLCIDRAFT_7121 [Scleroderma citrinum Foug A]|uniref:CASTOR ACT domain-containing protein n=1 Tax=Scleroderma citrinum Foug A TaxID=1036808 RepID=A0A0C3E830_9AGAM|nr:hypothetical protein SCLCIDRAFT_7121 [Scleroderma citrinum Foug A]
MARPSNVTITLLPVSLSLVHIPRSRLPQLTHPILRQILQPNPTFFNVTCNEIELTLFAEHHNILDLDLIARHDRRAHRSRSGSGSGRKRSFANDCDQVEITCEHWNVLQIDSHSDQLDNSGARVHELSAPLAAAGISILYQSSYMSDFIFVKESRLHQVMTLLRASGFDLYSSDAEHSPTRITSPLISPTLVYEMNAHELGHEFSLESGAVLTRSVDASADRSSFSQNYVSKHEASHRPSRTKSHSPSLTDVSILSTDLACVGLCDESMDNWALKIVKLVAFPDLIPLKSRPHRPNPYFYGSNGVANIPFVKHSETIQIPNFLPRSRTGSYSTDTTLSSPSDEADDGYFSHSPAGNEPPEGFLSSPASHSYPDLSQSVQSMSPSFKPTTKRVVSPSPLFSFDSKSTCLQLNGSTPARQPATVPFFSFTRTSEGSSLTTDVSVLAALFPPSERHMLICAGDLDAPESGSSDDSEGSDEDEEEMEGGTLKCLQIDLRRFGLG